VTTNLDLSNEEFQQIRDYLETISGIAIGENKAYLVENRLAELLPEFDCTSYGSLCFKAKTHAGLRDRMVDLMTTNETLWFRDQHPFITFKEHLLPIYMERLRKGEGRNKIRIWSAACSTGQEPYSLAMILLDSMAGKSWLKPSMFEIMATDISPTCLQTAEQGIYDQVAIRRGLADQYRGRFFTNVGKHWSVNDQVKAMVNFKQFNLQDSFTGFGRFDLILCRNVAIYFSREFKKILFKKFGRSLEKDGVFFLGASESLSGYSSDFEIMKYKQGFYYKTLV